MEAGRQSGGIEMVDPWQVKWPIEGIEEGG